MYILMRQNGARDFSDRIALDQITPKDTQLHHIFPWDFMMSDKRALSICSEAEYSRGEYRALVNDIANLTFLRQATNSGVGKREPADYLKEIPEAILKAHFIPLDQELWQPEHYEEFLNARRKLISVAVGRFMKWLA
jgi:hypothetical protein